MSGSRGIRFLSRMSLPKIPTRKLNDGTHFPLIAYGTGTALVRLAPSLFIVSCPEYH